MSRPLRPLFEDVSVTVEAGDRLGVVGINGTGKSTLLEAIAAVGGKTDFADMGKVRLIRGMKSSDHDLRQVGRNPKVDVELKPGDKVILRAKTFFPGR